MFTLTRHGDTFALRLDRCILARGSFADLRALAAALTSPAAPAANVVRFPPPARRASQAA